MSFHLMKFFALYRIHKENTNIFVSGRHSSYCPSHPRSVSPGGGGVAQPSGRHQSQQRAADLPRPDPEPDTSLEPELEAEVTPATARRHSPHCRGHDTRDRDRERRHHRHRHHRHRQQQPEAVGEAGAYQSGLYSVDVEYGYNYTRVGRTLQTKWCQRNTEVIFTSAQILDVGAFNKKKHYSTPFPNIVKIIANILVTP